MRILVIVIRMLHTFMEILIHRLVFQELRTLWSRIMKSGRLPLNDRHSFLFLLISWIYSMKVEFNFDLKIKYKTHTNSKFNKNNLEDYINKLNFNDFREK